MKSSLKKPTSVRVVLLRHGESEWNKENRFTGWTDVDLSPQGEAEALRAGLLLQAEKFEFDLAFTSVLKRAIRTLWAVLKETDQVWLPVHRAWQLNERHYGALQGLNKAETAAKHGEDQVFTWRRSYTVRPPALKVSDPRHPKNDRRYQTVVGKTKSNAKAVTWPGTESLKDCLDRVVPYWKKSILPQVLSGRRVLIAAHGNSLRALIKHLEGISDQDIMELNIPTGIPLVYEFSVKKGQLRLIRKFYLGDAAAADAAAKAVAAQGAVARLPAKKT
jgi:2,3-bisphosphoglycerate-dependent phosphoglycerate mutase